MPSCEPEADPRVSWERASCSPRHPPWASVWLSPPPGAPAAPGPDPVPPEEPESSPEPSAGVTWRASSPGTEPGAVLARAVLPQLPTCPARPLFQDLKSAQEADPQGPGAPRQRALSSADFSQCRLTSLRSRCRLGGPQGLAPSVWAEGQTLAGLGCEPGRPLSWALLTVQSHWRDVCDPRCRKGKLRLLAPTRRGSDLLDVREDREGDAHPPGPPPRPGPCEDPGMQSDPVLSSWSGSSFAPRSPNFRLHTHTVNRQEK